MKTDALREQYHDHLWDAEFRDDQDAKVTVNGQDYPEYSVFRRQEGKRAVVVVNTRTSSFIAHVTFLQRGPFACVGKPRRAGSPPLHRGYQSALPFRCRA